MKRPPSARKSPPQKRGAKKAIGISVHSKKQISSLLARFRLQPPLLTFRDVRDALNRKCGTALSVATVWRMGKGHMPKDLVTRRALGLVGQRKPDTRQIVPGIWAAGGKPVYVPCDEPLPGKSASVELAAAAGFLAGRERR